MRVLPAAVSLILLGVGLWMGSAGWVGEDPRASRPENRVERQAERFAQSLAANDVDDLYSFFGRDLRSLFSLHELKRQWRVVEAARVVRGPEVEGDWAEFVVELSLKEETKPSFYLVIFRWEEADWKLFATLAN